MTVSSLAGYGLTMYQLKAQFAYALLGNASNSEEQTDWWSFVANQQNDRVTMSLEKVGDRLVQDMAVRAADYLVDRTELSEEYVLVIVDPPTGDLEVKAFRRADLVKALEGEQLSAAMDALAENRLLYVTSEDELPDMPEDEELTGLADQIQAFLDDNKKLIDILDREGLLPWGETAA